MSYYASEPREKPAVVAHTGISALRRLKQEGRHKLKAILGYSSENLSPKRERER